MPKRINLKGPLIANNSQEVYDYYGMEATSAKSIINQLPEDSSDIILEVNSNGGLVTVGSEVYMLLKRLSIMNLLLPVSRKPWMKRRRYPMLSCRKALDKWPKSCQPVLLKSLTLQKQQVN